MNTILNCLTRPRFTLLGTLVGFALAVDAVPPDKSFIQSLLWIMGFTVNLTLFAWLIGYIALPRGHDEQSGSRDELGDL